MPITQASSNESADSCAGIGPLVGHRTRLVHWATLCAIIVIGAWLRFHDLGAASLWLEEAFAWSQSKDSLGDLISRTAQDVHLPLNNLFLYASINLLGDAEWSLRLPSAIFGTANILAIYWLGSMAGGRTTGLLAAAFLALSGFHVWYSQEARMYALFSLTTTLFAASSFFFVKSPTTSRGALVSLAGLALLYSHPFGALYWIAIVIAISLFKLTAPDTPRRTIVTWVVSNGLAAAGFAPWAWLVLQKAIGFHEHGFADWAPYPSLEVIDHELNDVVGTRVIAAVILVGIVLAFLPSKHAVGAEGQRATKTSVLVFLVWAVLPIALVVFISIASTPMFAARYLIGSLPALLLASAYGLSRYVRGRTGLWVVAILSVAVVTGYVRYTTPSHPDWRGVAAMLRERAGPSDCVFVYRRNAIVPFSYYSRKQLPCQILLGPVEDHWEKSITSDRLLSLGSVEDLKRQSIADRLFVVFWNGNPEAETDQLLDTLGAGVWSMQQRFEFDGVQAIEFGKAK
jgi:uncharacterized membrane protein